jgi:hypothetical protein
MTKQEAITAMREGKKVTHRYFTSDEWITLNGYMIVTEEGYSIPEHAFWKDRQSPSFEDGWSIYYEQDPEQLHLL